MRFEICDFRFPIGTQKLSIFASKSKSALENLKFQGWPTGLEPATTRTTIWGSTIELRPPSEKCRTRSLRFAASFAKDKGLAFSVRFRHSDCSVDGSIATIRRRIIIAPRHRMKRIGPVLLASIFTLLAADQVWAAQDDPSEIFLKAYMTAQQAEKLEHENQFKTALAKYRFAGSLIEELRRSHPDWQSAIVEYRGRKNGEGILRIQDKVSTQNELQSW